MQYGITVGRQYSTLPCRHALAAAFAGFPYPFPTTLPLFPSFSPSPSLFIFLSRSHSLHSLSITPTTTALVYFPVLTALQIPPLAPPFLASHFLPLLLSPPHGPGVLVLADAAHCRPSPSPARPWPRPRPGPGPGRPDSREEAWVGKRGSNSRSASNRERDGELCSGRGAGDHLHNDQP